MVETVKKYQSSSEHPAYLRGKHAVIQEGINWASSLLENAINNFSVEHNTSTTTHRDDHITDFIDTYLCDDAYTSDIDTDEDN